jgi:uncharacterized membrane protein
MRGLSPAKLLSAAVSGLLLIPLAGATPAAAVELVTPYPAVAAEPGRTATFDLQIVSDVREPVSLRVTEVPDGWHTVLRGDGREVEAAFATPDEPAEVQLEVRVPPDAEAGRHTVTITGEADSGSATLPLTLTIVEQAADAFELTAGFPALQGTAEDSFRFELTLANHTGEEATFALAAAGPEGWNVQARPSTEQQAATITVDGGGTARINVEADPPEDTPAGSYQIGVRASGEARNLDATLTVEIAESSSMALSTTSERLNASGPARRAGTVVLVIQNDGNAPLQGVELSATPPTNWEVEFDPTAVDVIMPGESREVTARVIPAGNAIAGDYAVTLRAAGEGHTESIEIRYTVQTSGWWGLVGILVIVAAIAALALVYRRYGRR